MGADKGRFNSKQERLLAKRYTSYVRISVFDAGKAYSCLDGCSDRDASHPDSRLRPCQGTYLVLTTLAKVVKGIRRSQDGGHHVPELRHDTHQDVALLTYLLLLLRLGKGGSP